MIYSMAYIDPSIVHAIDLCPLGADSLAYLTAATHGLTEEADSIAETLSARLDKVKKTVILSPWRSHCT